MRPLCQPALWPLFALPAVVNILHRQPIFDGAPQPVRQSLRHRRADAAAAIRNIRPSVEGATPSLAAQARPLMPFGAG